MNGTGKSVLKEAKAAHNKGFGVIGQDIITLAVVYYHLQLDVII